MFLCFYRCFGNGGSSYPEHAFEFFTPIFEWLQRYVEQGPRPVQLTVLFDYLNTSSLKCIIDLFKLLESHAQNGAEVAIHWRYQIDDEDMLEAGREFAEDIQIPIHFHPV